MTAAEGVRWIDRFIADMPTNRVGLDPYPIALRAINWVKFFSRFPMESTAERRDSLYSQLRLLERKLEYHCLATICWRTHTRFILAARILKTAVCTAGRVGYFAGS